MTLTHNTAHVIDSDVTFSYNFEMVNNQFFNTNKNTNIRCNLKENRLSRPRNLQRLRNSEIGDQLRKNYNCSFPQGSFEGVRNGEEMIQTDVGNIERKRLSLPRGALPF